MNIIYNTKTNKIISTISSNFNGKNFSLDLLRKTFPKNLDLSYFILDSNILDNLIGGDVFFYEDIPFKIVKNNQILFELSLDKIKNIKDLKNKENRQKLYNIFPYTFNKGSVESFVSSLMRSNYTNEITLESLNDGSYFDKKIQKVGWWGCFTDAGGYANMNRSIVSRLHNYNIIPYIRMYKTPSQIESSAQGLLNNYLDLIPKKGSHPFVYAYTPMAHEYHHGKRIFFTMFETATLHPLFVDQCNKYCDEIWVPSENNKEIFILNGIKKNIKVVPLGIDEKIYFQKPSANKFEGFLSLFGKPVEEGLNNFKFLTVIQWNFRKGFDALIKSFVNSFTSKDDVCLVITTQYQRDVVLNDLKQFIPRESDLPQVVLYNHIIPTIDMPDYYRQFDCYVHLSRGEGFSLTQIEAGACKLPVISAYHSGMTEYLNVENSFIIPCDELEKCQPRLAAICFYYQDQMLWKLGKKQVDLASEYMRYIFNNFNEAKKRAEIFYSQIESKYTWEKTAERVYKNLI